jgi:hypothetical protein
MDIFTVNSSLASKPADLKKLTLISKKQDSRAKETWHFPSRWTAAVRIFQLHMRTNRDIRTANVASAAFLIMNTDNFTGMHLPGSEIICSEKIFKHGLGVLPLRVGQMYHIETAT